MVGKSFSSAGCGCTQGSQIVGAAVSGERAVDPKRVQTLRFLHPGGPEFVGWWNNWNLQEPITEVRGFEKIARPITLLRRK